MARRNLIIADGTLAIATAEITAGPSDDAGWVNVFLANVGTVEETVILTLTRGTAGTARRFKRIILKENESCEITGFPLGKDDSLKGYTTTASVVEYFVSVAPEGSPYRFAIYDSDGIEKNMGALNEALYQGAFIEP